MLHLGRVKDGHPLPEEDPNKKKKHEGACVDAAASCFAIGHAALDAAIANFPDQRFTLRNGILVIRQHVP